MSGYWLPWCTSHYRSSFCKEKAKELRAQGEKVRLGAYIKEPDKDGVMTIYYKIYIWQEG